MDILESSSKVGVSKLYPMGTLGLVCMTGQLDFFNIIKLPKKSKEYYFMICENYRQFNC